MDLGCIPNIFEKKQSREKSLFGQINELIYSNDDAVQAAKI